MSSLEYIRLLAVVLDPVNTKTKIACKHYSVHNWKHCKNGSKVANWSRHIIFRGDFNYWFLVNSGFKPKRMYSLGEGVENNSLIVLLMKGG